MKFPKPNESGAGVTAASQEAERTPHPKAGNNPHMIATLEHMWYKFVLAAHSPLTEII